MNTTKTAALLAFMWMLCALPAYSEDMPKNLTEVIAKIVGGWKTEKIEVLNKEVYGAVSEKDRVTMVFDDKGVVLWTFFLTESSQEAPMRLNYMIGSDHISFCGGPTGGANEVPIWTMKFEENRLILATQEPGVRFTFQRIKEGEQAGHGDAEEAD